jgi:hypothetical protein
VPLRVGPLVVAAVQVLEDRVLARDDLAVVGDEHRDLVGSGRLPHSDSVVRLRGDLPCGEVEAQLGQPLADAVGMRAPLGLEEVHAGGVAARDAPETA